MSQALHGLEAARDVQQAEEVEHGGVVAPLAARGQTRAPELLDKGRGARTVSRGCGTHTPTGDTAIRTGRESNGGEKVGRRTEVGGEGYSVGKDTPLAGLSSVSHKVAFGVTYLVT